MSSAIPTHGESPHISKILMAIGIALVSNQSCQPMLEADEAFEATQSMKAYSSLQQRQPHDVVSHRIAAADGLAGIFGSKLSLAYYLFWFNNATP